MRSQFVFHSAKHSLCGVASFCLLLGSGLGDAQTLASWDFRFASVENVEKTNVCSGSRSSMPHELNGSSYGQALQGIDVEASESSPIKPPFFSFPDCPHGVEPQPFNLDINGLRVLVDFIVNAQGRTESPLILKSSGEANAKLVVDIIRRWRFSPATCNGAATEVEIRMLFVGPRKTLPRPIVPGTPGM